MSGTLYLCATPIGNMEDITYRVVRILNEVDLIAAEDTRTSKKLLDRYNINTRVTSYHEHNKIEKAKTLINKLHDGNNIALITDAGTPGISDPGEELVAMCYDENIEVTSLPGAAALITAITMSGQSSRRFVFEAFLPKDKKYRRHVLEELKNETRTIIVYESPHHLKSTLKELESVLGKDRELTITRELTKRHEEKNKTTFEKALEYYEENEPRGEYVLVIAGKSKAMQEEERREMWEETTIKEHMDIYLKQGLDKKEAMKAVAKDRGVSKRDIYKELID
ncbi:MAG: 16S rRNA (cytidine(1402)-2'-O)-methyltransferase [Lachnospiraceae bacterium]|nr:16S rRNA (cytidine(1402)-2'-O)-methyltransferase [Lachnospiraceae bacterium]